MLRFRNIRRQNCGLTDTDTHTYTKTRQLTIRVALKLAPCEPIDYSESVGGDRLPWNVQDSHAVSDYRVVRHRVRYPSSRLVLGVGQFVCTLV